MKNISAKARLARAEKLSRQTEALPKLYIENEQEYFYGQSSREEKEEGKRSLQAKRETKTELQLKVKSFIKLAYGNDSEYAARFGQIKFTFEEMGMVYTGLDAMNKQWREARHSLIWLFKNIIAEERERAKIEEIMVESAMRRQWALTVVCFMGLLFVWNIPQDYMVYIFNKESLFAVRSLLSLAALLFATAFVFEEQWRQLVVSSIIATVLGIAPFIKSDKTATGGSDVLVDSPKVVKKGTIVSPQKIRVDSLEKSKAKPKSPHK